MLINNKNYVDFLVVGAAKAGTSSLFHYLKSHPEVFLTEQKELLFWHLISNPNKTQSEYMNFFINSIDEYLSFFEDSKESQICGDITPSYLYYHDYVIKNLQKHHPKWQDVKIIIILREPVDKVISHYKFLLSGIGANEKSLEDTLAKEKKRLKENKILPDYFLIDNTLYYKQVKAFMDNFRNIKILLYDDLKENPIPFINEICSFLGISHFKDKTIVNKKHNVSKVRYIPKYKLPNKLFQINSKLGITRNLKSLLGILKNY